MFQGIVIWRGTELTETRWKLKTIICKICNEPFDVYLIKTGVCFNCQKKINDKKYYIKHQERLREYTRNWSRNNHKLKTKNDREYYKKNKNDINCAKRDKRMRSHRPRKLKPFHLWVSKWGKNKNEKARRLIHRAVGMGRIIKPNKCSCCKRKLLKRLIHAHHEDYNKWWIVIWLCQTCHSELHLLRNTREDKD